VPLGFFPADFGLPWVVSSSGEGAWAVAIKNARLAATNLSGFDAMFDARQIQRRLRLAPAGEPGDTVKVTIYFAVGDSDFNSALANLAEVLPRPLPGWELKLKPFSGKVMDQQTGAPLAGAAIELAIRNRMGQWRFFTGLVSDEQGEFRGLVPDRGRKYRLTASLPGRPSPEPIHFKLDDRPYLELEFSSPGRLAYQVRDETGRLLPVKVGLYQEGGLVRTIYSRTGQDELEVEPGAYEVSVTRGYEYIPYEGELVIEPNRTARLEAVLVRAVNTEGFLSVDMHVHAGPSGDNKISIADRIKTVAAEGLEVAVATDHEAIISWQPGVDETGLGEWVAVVTGQEVTATVPEHINGFPFEPRFDNDDRGGPVPWHGLDIAQVYAAIRERGGEVVQLNHPLEYFRLIEYDLESGEVGLERPELLGLPPDAALWSWEFDSFEFQNGCKPVFHGQIRQDDPGTFDYWMSFVNLGHRITADANSDAHDFSPPGAPPGSPRNYFPSSTDRPAEFRVEELIQAVKQGRILTSTGAFARVMVNDRAGMGDTIAVHEDHVELRLRIEAIPQIDVTHFKVFVNCDQVMTVQLPDAGEVVKFDGRVQVPIAGDSQIVVMGFGEKQLPRGLHQFDPLGVPRFASNPIYVDKGGDGWTPPGFDGCDYTLP